MTMQPYVIPDRKREQDALVKGVALAGEEMQRFYQFLYSSLIGMFPEGDKPAAWTPTERRTWYEAHEPACLIPLSVWLDDYDRGYPQPLLLGGPPSLFPSGEQPKVDETGMAVVDPMTGQPVTEPVFLPYWQTCFRVNQKRCVQMLRDWAKMQRGESDGTAG